MEVAEIWIGRGRCPESILTRVSESTVPECCIPNSSDDSCICPLLNIPPCMNFTDHPNLMPLWFVRLCNALAIFGINRELMRRGISLEIPAFLVNDCERE